MKEYIIKTYYIAEVVHTIKAKSGQEAYNQAKEIEDLLTYDELLKLCPNGLVWQEAECLKISKNGNAEIVEVDINE